MAGLGGFVVEDDMGAVFYLRSREVDGAVRRSALVGMVSHQATPGLVAVAERALPVHSGLVDEAPGWGRSAVDTWRPRGWCRADRWASSSPREARRA